MRGVDYGRLPEHMREGARMYVEHGGHPGHFLRAVVENDLVGAFAAADEKNFAHMADWARWLYNEAPRACWGSREAVRAWIEMRAEQRIRREKEKLPIRDAMRRL